MIDLSMIARIDGWQKLTDDQRNILFIVLQDHHAALPDLILPQNVVRVLAGDHDYQVLVHYLDGAYYYEIDSKTGRSIWFM